MMQTNRPQPLRKTFRFKISHGNPFKPVGPGKKKSKKEKRRIRKMHERSRIEGDTTES